MRTLLIKRQKINNEKLKLAKEFRKKMTLAEKAFWNMVRQNQIEGLHFRRQQVIHGFIADFYCNEIGLVIEIDGGIHEQQKDYDKLRDHIITAYGVKVIRFTNEEVLDKSDWVAKRLKEETREAVNK
jgi:very-short-patch-repair endonuclease